MRTTPEECRAIGAFIAARLNAASGPVRFLIPERGVSALDIAGGAFHDPDANAALFDALEADLQPPPTAGSSACRSTSTTPHSPTRSSPPTAASQKADHARHSPRRHPRSVSTP